MLILYRRYIKVDMNISQMRNIVVLKDLPSNIVDEAIIILKNNSKVKKKEIIENPSYFKKMGESSLGNNDVAVREAELVVQNYLKDLEHSKETKRHVNIIVNKYKKLQICSFLFMITTIIGIIISIIK